MTDPPAPASDEMVMFKYGGPSASLEVDGKVYQKGVPAPMTRWRFEELLSNVQLREGRHVLDIEFMDEPVEDLTAAELKAEVEAGKEPVLTTPVTEPVSTSTAEAGAAAMDAAARAAGASRVPLAWPGVPGTEVVPGDVPAVQQAAPAVSLPVSAPDTFVPDVVVDNPSDDAASDAFVMEAPATTDPASAE